MLLVRSPAGVLVRQRPASGLLGGLWEFPCVDLADGQEPNAAAARLLADQGLHGEASKVGEVKHAYSHFKLELNVFRVEVETAPLAAESASHCWCGAEALATLPLHGAHRKACDKFNREA